mmetsp:Transcript_8946/g.13375  ORF Transcript_8946/g.13375 Transcript_8946/m.13375 type:complete len:633 (-) Transcript_8946:82-1980(-)
MSNKNNASAIARSTSLPERGQVLCETPGSIVFQSVNDKKETIVVKKIKIVDEESFDRFDKELEIMASLNESYIIRPLAVCERAPNYAYILPWMPHGSLYEVMHVRLIPLQKQFPLVVLLSLDLARAVQKLHETGVIHRDIKPHNLLLDKQGFSKLTDFGLSEYEEKLKADGDEVLKPNRPSAGFKKIMGTFEYMAPELFQKKQHTRACDVYALGVSMNELFTGQLPYMGAEKDTENFYTVVDTRYDRLSLMKAICTQALRPDIIAPMKMDSKIESRFVALIKSCWDHDPTKRPTAKEIVKSLEDLCSDINLPLNSDRSKYVNDAVKAAPKIEAPRQYVKPRTAALPDLELDEKKLKPQSEKKELELPLTVKAGVISTRGKRGYMEDYHLLQPRLFGQRNMHVYGVFDGHGGEGCAKFVSANLIRHLEPLKSGNKDPVAVLKRAFALLHHEFMNSPASETDASGTTALVALFIGRKLYIANAGDSMAVLARKGQKAEQLSRMHLAGDTEEKKLIEERGGQVKRTADGKYRTNGVIQLSRAIGDRKVARYITAEPEVKSYDILPSDEFLVLATDGLWDALSPQKTVDILFNTVKHHDYGAKSVVADALQLGSDDNITTIVAYFKNEEEKLIEDM